MHIAFKSIASFFLAINNYHNTLAGTIEAFKMYVTEHGNKEKPLMKLLAK